MFSSKALEKLYYNKTSCKIIFLKISIANYKYNKTIKQ